MSKKQLLLYGLIAAVAIALALTVVFCIVKIAQIVNNQDNSSNYSSHHEYISDTASLNDNSGAGELLNSALENSTADTNDTQKLTILFPSQKEWETSEAVQVFSGKCNTAERLTVNGAEIKVNGNGEFVYTAELSEGKNTFTFRRGEETQIYTVVYSPAQISYTPPSADTGKETKTENFIYHYREPLTHTYKRLTEDKELSIVYYGGSVTAGYGASEGYGLSEGGTSWACLLTNWFKYYFKDAKITTYNAAIGATGTYVGAYRLEDDVLSHKPDLVFLEYAINDYYRGETRETAALQFETIVREIRKAYPKCDIITVLTADEYVINEATLFSTAAGHEEISEYYGIPSVNVGHYIWTEMEKNHSDWSKYFTDIVHPNDSGYRKYFDCLSTFLDEALRKTDFSGLEDTSKALKAVKSKHLFDGERRAVMGEELKSILIKEDTSGFVWNKAFFDGSSECPHNGFYEASNNKNSKIAFKFSGTELAVWTNLRASSKIRYSVDGKDRKEISCSDNSPTVIAEGLKSGEHTVILAPADLGSGVNEFKIHAVFTRDTAKQTVR